MGMRAWAAATQTRLHMYDSKIAKLDELYGQGCWWLVQRMRSEHMERIRRKCEEERAAAVAAGGTHPLDPLMPWDFCFKVAAQDRKFWEEELDRKRMLYHSPQDAVPVVRLRNRCVVGAEQRSREPFRERRRRRQFGSTDCDEAQCAPEEASCNRGRREHGRHGTRSRRNSQGPRQRKGPHARRAMARQ